MVHWMALLESLVTLATPWWLSWGVAGRVAPVWHLTIHTPRRYMSARIHAPARHHVGVAQTIIWMLYYYYIHIYGSPNLGASFQGSPPTCPIGGNGQAPLLVVCRGGGLVANQPRRQPSLGTSGLVGCLPLRGSIRVGWLSWCDKAMCSSSPATCSRYLTSFNQMAILYNKVL